MKQIFFGLLAASSLLLSLSGKAQGPFGQSKFNASSFNQKNNGNGQGNNGNNNGNANGNTGNGNGQGNNGNGNGNGGSNNTRNVPFDGGLSLLLIAGAAYGAKKFTRRNALPA